VFAECEVLGNYLEDFVVQGAGKGLSFSVARISLLSILQYSTARLGLCHKVEIQHVPNGSRIRSNVEKL